MPPRYQSTLLSFEEKARNLFDHFGQPAHRGHARMGGGLRLGSQAQSLVQNAAASTAALKGQLLVLAASAASVASGGDYLAFDAEVYRNGFETPVSADGTTIIWPTSVVGAIQVELKWASYTGGGKIEIEVDGVVPAWGLLADATSGQEGEKRRTVDIEAGSAVRIKVTQASGSVQAGDVLVQFSIFGPTGSTATPVVVTSSSGYADDDVTVAAPSGIVVGDLLLAFVASREPTITSPAGWTRQVTSAAVPGDDYAACLDVRRVEAADIGSSWQWSVGAGAFPNRSAQVLIVAVRRGSSVAASDGDYSTGVSSVTQTVNAVDGGLLVMFAGSAAGSGATTHSYPTSMNEHTERQDTNPVSGATDTISAASEVASGSVSRTVTFSQTSDAYGLLVSVI